MTIPNDSVPDMSSHGFEFGSPLLDMKYHTGNYFYQYITKKMQIRNSKTFNICSQPKVESRVRVSVYAEFMKWWCWQQMKGGWYGRNCDVGIELECVFAKNHSGQ